MWHSIAKQISDALHRPFHISRREPLIQDDECRRMLLEGSGLTVFVKLLPRHQLEQLALEMRGLERLRQAQCVRLPQPYCCGCAGEQAFLAMEFIPLSTGVSEDWFGLGQQLADQHEKSEQGMFGWDEDNYFNDLSQPNRWQRNWAQFFAEQRIGWQLQLLAEKGIHLSNIAELITIVQRLLSNHHPQPALLHGNLWSNKLGFAQGNAVLLDPACYLGDREVDLAMSELFDALPEAFYNGYYSRWQAPEGQDQRRIIYNLYPLLAHLNRYGEPYRQVVEKQLHQVLAL